MASERISQILPTVKCSDCGRDVLIRRLGDHLCSSQPPVPSLPIIPAMKGLFLFLFLKVKGREREHRH